MGPKARDVLAAVTGDDVSNAAFSFATCRDITIGDATVRALRITFVGELGWELHMPIAAMADVYDRLMDAGGKHGIANAGYRAIESLRLEKGYRVWSADITPGDSPFEAGLGWAVKLNKETPFLGRDAAAAARGTPPAKRLACFTVDDPAAVLLGRETIYRNGEPAGWLTSGGWGYTVGKNIGYGYVRHESGVTMDYLKSGTYELEVACERVPCELHIGALCDPNMERIKA
jgi:4-methylaminobutanoate oxidase (formaldehyde-forming)